MKRFHVLNIKLNSTFGRYLQSGDTCPPRLKFSRLGIIHKSHEKISHKISLMTFSFTKFLPRPDQSLYCFPFPRPLPPRPRPPRPPRPRPPPLLFPGLPLAPPPPSRLAPAGSNVPGTRLLTWCQGVRTFVSMGVKATLAGTVSPGWTVVYSLCRSTCPVLASALAANTLQKAPYLTLSQYRGIARGRARREARC